MENKDSFKYTYSAKEQEEIRSIRKKYSAPEEDKMERLRRLDKSVTTKGTVVSLIVGIVGALVLGMGMSLIMTDIGSFFGFSDYVNLMFGIIIGFVGIILISLAYPLYNIITNKEREKISTIILMLTDELLK